MQGRAQALLVAREQALPACYSVSACVGALAGGVCKAREGSLSSWAVFTSAKNCYIFSLHSMQHGLLALVGYLLAMDCIEDIDRVVSARGESMGVKAVLKLNRKRRNRAQRKPSESPWSRGL